VWGSVSDWFNENVATPVAGWFRGVWTNVSSYFGQLWEDVKVVWETVAAWFSSVVISPITNFFSNAWKNIKQGFEEAFTAIKGFAVGIFNGLIGNVESAVNFIIRAINGLLGGFNNAAAWAADVLGKEWSGVSLVKEVSLGRIQVKENGGFLEDGLFTMNHGEIAGKFNNGKSVVANNEQIVEGIAAGVYQAVVAAMNATSGRGEQSVNVYLDGKQIATAVEKRQSERGRTLMGNQLGYVY
jgi:phage-related protein